MRLPTPSHLAVGRLFLTAVIGAFIATVAILAGAGYAITEITVRQPRDPFRTGSFEFDLAPGWWCEREGTEYVCNPPGESPYSAIAVVAIKERGAEATSSYKLHARSYSLVPSESMQLGSKMVAGAFSCKAVPISGRWLRPLSSFMSRFMRLVTFFQNA